MLQWNGKCRNCLCVFLFFRAFFSCLLWKKQSLPQFGTLTVGFFTILAWTVLHELLWFRISSSTNTKKMQTYEAKFSLLSIDGAWRVSVVCEQELVVFSPVFESWFFATSFLRSSSSSRLWGLSFWEEEDEDPVAGRSHMQNQSFHMYKKTKNLRATKRKKEKKKASRRISDGSVRWRGYPHRFFKEGRRICGSLED